ncbi:MAG: 1-deoxy-D-xylulose 5-phosphate reductoisomerase, partial [Alphaproteobacteria bacterium MarineAlpha5_Bin6]
MKENININIFGSTGEIGTKSLSIISKYFNKLKINILYANVNYKKLLKQTNTFHPKFICINDSSKLEYLKKNIKNNSTKVIHKSDLNKIINNNKTDISILAIAGFNSLEILPSLF